ncbi:MAG: hypothetical protein ACLR5T_02260 [Veillonella sp.]
MEASSAAEQRQPGRPDDPYGTGVISTLSPMFTYYFQAWKYDSYYCPPAFSPRATDFH